MNGHLFWFSLIILIFSVTYCVVVYRDYTALKEMSIGDYKKRFKFTQSTLNSSDYYFELDKEVKLDLLKKLLINKILAFSIGPLAALIISIFGGSNIYCLILGHILNWLSIYNLLYQNYQFRHYHWKEIVSKAIAFSSIIFVPFAFYYIVFGGNMNSLATYVTIFGFPITLASILTFISNKR